MTFSRLGKIISSLGVVFLFATSAMASSVDEKDFDSERLDGYSEYKQDLQNFDKLRLKARVFNEELEEQDRLQSEEALRDYRRSKSKEFKPENTNAYTEYLNEKFDNFEERLRIEKEYARDQKVKTRNKNQNLKKHVSEEEELDLYSHRERSDIKKRVLYGGIPDFKSLRNSGSSIGGGFSGGSGQAPSVVNDGGNFSFPTPPPPPQTSQNGFGGYDESGDTGFIPQAPIEPFDPNEIPPPPPMPMDDTFLPPPDMGDF